MHKDEGLFKPAVTEAEMRWSSLGRQAALLTSDRSRDAKRTGVTPPRSPKTAAAEACQASGSRQIIQNYAPRFGSWGGGVGGGWD